MNNKLNNIYFSYIDFVAFIIVIISLILNVLTIIQSVSSTSEFFDYIIAYSLVILYFLYRLLKLNIIKNRRINLITKYCHDLNHEIRDYIYCIENKIDEYSLTTLISDFETKNKDLLKKLNEILESSTNSKIEISIKWFKPNRDKDILFDFCKLDTNIEKDYEINKYCGLDLIFNHGHSHFYAPSLKTAVKSYQSQTEKEYTPVKENSSCIIVPIRIEDKYVHRNSIVGSEYTYNHKGLNHDYICYGVLCIKALTINAFRKSEKLQYINLVKCFTNSLHHMYAKFNYLFSILPCDTNCNQTVSIK